MITSSGINSTAQLIGPPQGITAFAFENNAVRVVVRDGNPWFVAADICAVLDIQNPTDAITRLDDDEKSTLASTEGGPNRNVVSESGLYTLIMTSRKPEARKFKRWITAEVIPAIRRTGSYSVQSRPLSDLTVAEAQLHIVREDRLEAITSQQAAMSAQLDQICRLVRPTAYSRRDMQLDKAHVWFDDTARLLGTRPRRLYKFLREHGILSKDFRGRNRPVKTYFDEGYVALVYDNYLYFTVKGRMWMHHNANMGWLDSILDREALIARLTPEAGLSLPLNFGPKPR